MMKEFEQLKGQLAELASVLNSFKSEAVQLRIVDLLFKGSIEEDPGEVPSTDDETPVRERVKRKPKSTETPSKTRIAPRTGRLGPVSAVDKLIKEGFFKTKKKIGDIVEHCSHKLALKIKPNDISGRLARLVRDGTLDREKNQDGQYEYISKQTSA